MEKMALAEFYAGIYIEDLFNTSTSNSVALKTTLDLALPELYAAVIVFSIKARQYFNARCRIKSNLFYVCDYEFAYEYGFRDKGNGKHVEAI